MFKTYRKRGQELLIACLLIMPFMGCFSKSDNRHSVTGVVTMDQKPLADGEMTFICFQDKRAEATSIKNGQYRLRVSPGTHRVEIRAFIVINSQENDPIGGSSVTQSQILPACFNDDSSLRIDVSSATISQTFNFSVGTNCPPAMPH